MKQIKTLIILLTITSISACGQRLVNDGLDKELAAEKHIDAAKAYIEEQNSRKALSHLQKAEDFEKKSVELFHAYALLYSLEGDLKQEEYYYKKALREDRKNSMVKNNYGSFLCFHGEPKAGLKLLEDATEDYSYLGRAEAYVNRGLCELVSEDKDAAEKSFQQSLRLNTASARPLLELSDIYLQKDDIRLADMYYTQFVGKVAQQSARSLLLGIRIAKKKGDENAASSYALSLEKRFPESAEHKAYKAGNL